MSIGSLYLRQRCRPSGSRYCFIWIFGRWQSSWVAPWQLSCTRLLLKYICHHEQIYYHSCILISPNQHNVIVSLSDFEKVYFWMTLSSRVRYFLRMSRCWYDIDSPEKLCMLESRYHLSSLSNTDSWKWKRSRIVFLSHSNKFCPKVAWSGKACCLLGFLPLGERSRCWWLSGM